MQGYTNWKSHGVDNAFLQKRGGVIVFNFTSQLITFVIKARGIHIGISDMDVNSTEGSHESGSGAEDRAHTSREIETHVNCKGFVTILSITSVSHMMPSTCMFCSGLGSIRRLLSGIDQARQMNSRRLGGQYKNLLRGAGGRLLFVLDAGVLSIAGKVETLVDAVRAQRKGDLLAESCWPEIHNGYMAFPKVGIVSNHYIDACYQMRAAEVQSARVWN